MIIVKQTDDSDKWQELIDIFNFLKKPQDMADKIEIFCVAKNNQVIMSLINEKKLS